MLNIVSTVILTVVLYLNGMLRIIFTSKRLNMIKKVTIASIMLIPILHILLIAYVCRAVKDQYEHECYRVNSDKLRISSQVCKTKYPIVLIHGFGFKDLKYINYWGRIPNELIKNGATIYYGNQEAWGTVEYNANDIKQKILG
ncbi:MAG TPA: triacylglycerol lipase, partial [Clostridia bacterium]